MWYYDKMRINKTIEELEKCYKLLKIIQYRKV